MGVIQIWEQLSKDCCAAKLRFWLTQNHYSAGLSHSLKVYEVFFVAFIESPHLLAKQSTRVDGRPKGLIG